MKAFFYILSTAIFIGLWFYFIDIHKIINYWQKVDIIYVLIAIALGVLQNFVAVSKLKLLLTLLGRISTLSLWAIGYLAAVLSTITVIPTGGISMVYYAKKKLSATYGKTIAVFLVDYLLNITITLLLAFSGFLFFSSIGKIKGIGLDLPSILSIALIIVSFLILIFIIFKSHFTSDKKLIKNKIFLKFISLFRQTKDGFLLASKAPLLLSTAFALAVINSMLGALEIFFYFKAFEVSLNFFTLLLAVNILAVFAYLPGAPTKLGQFEFFSLLTLPFLLSLNANVVFAVMLFSHLIGITIMLLGGIISFYFLRLPGDFFRRRVGGRTGEPESLFSIKS